MGLWPGSRRLTGSLELTAASSEQGKEDEDGGDRDESSEWYVEKMDEGIDHYMFPRTMGYLVLEKQYELFV